MLRGATTHTIGEAETVGSSAGCRLKVSCEDDCASAIAIACISPSTVLYNGGISTYMEITSSLPLPPEVEALAENTDIAQSRRTADKTTDGIIIFSRFAFMGTSFSSSERGTG